jgi:hypothetical protein
MTLYEFKLLSVNEQAEATWEAGVQIGFREAPPLHMVLYRVHDFYVEIQYHTAQNEIAGIHSFLSEDHLQPYLNQIDLSGLFNNL